MGMCQSALETKLSLAPGTELIFLMLKYYAGTN